mgnify:CR=1 FL=1
MRSVVHRIQHSWSHLGESVRSQYGEGFSGYLKFIYYSCLRVNDFVVYSRDITRMSASVNSLSGFRFREMTPAEIDPYRQGRMLPKEFFADGPEGPRLCHAVFKAGKPVYIHWVYQSGETSRFLKLSPDVAEIGYIVTLPEFRRMGVCSWALGHAFSRLESRGVKKVVTVVHSDNSASRRAMENVGMAEETVIRTIGPFNTRQTVQVV